MIYTVTDHYMLIDFTTITDKEKQYEMLRKYLKTDFYDIYHISDPFREDDYISLYRIVPMNLLYTRVPILFFVDDYRSLYNNSLWNDIRSSLSNTDLIIDRNANILDFEEII